MASHNPWSLGPLIAAAAAAALVLVSVPVAAQVQLPGVGAVKLLEARFDHTATLLDSGEVALIGGFDGTAETATIEVVDPATGTVKSVGTLIQARAGHTATPLADGTVLLAGGRADGTSLDHVETWDPSTGTSQAVRALRAARAEHEAVALSDGRVLIVGGENGGKPVAQTEIYDPATGESVAAGKLKSPHLGAAAVLLPNGRVLVTGTATKKKATPAETYLAGKGKWKPLNGTGERAGHTSTLLADGRVLLIGGLVGSAHFGATQLFDPAAGSFTDLPALQLRRSEHTATLLPDGRVIIIGGSDFGFEVAPIQVFDPVAGTLSGHGALEPPRDGHTTTLLPDGRILILGGDFAGLALSDALLYDVADGSASPLGSTGTVDSQTLDPAAPHTRAEVRARHGAPEAFVIMYGAGAGSEGSAEIARFEEWSYYTDGVVYTVAGDEVVAADPVALQQGVEVEPMPYDPDMFRPDMDLDDVLAATGVTEYMGGPLEQMIEGGRIFFADRLAWGITGDDLRYVEAFAFDTEGGPAEAVK